MCVCVCVCVCSVCSPTFVYELACALCVLKNLCVCNVYVIVLHYCREWYVGFSGVGYAGAKR